LGFLQPDQSMGRRTSAIEERRRRLPAPFPPPAVPFGAGISDLGSRTLRFFKVADIAA